MSNNPPDVVLEMSSEEAELLLASCTANMTFALGIMQNSLGRDILKKLIHNTEVFKSIRQKLINQGVVEKDEE